MIMITMSTQTAERKQFKLQLPPKYCNVFYNNDVTPVDVVVAILMKAFYLSEEDAYQKAMEIDAGEKGIIYINSKEVCDLKEEVVSQCMKVLKESNLKTTVELYEDESNV